MLEQVLDRCLVSQQIKDEIAKGRIQVPPLLKGQAQPSSFEPFLGDELFVLDTEAGAFRPGSREQVYRTLLQLPKRRRQKVNITDGFELKTGFTYLLPLQMKVNPLEEETIRSSPKSSLGRVFLHTRMIADYNQGFDEIHGSPEKTLDFWLSVQPYAFNVVVAPGISLNQVRFINGLGAKLSAAQIQAESKKNPLMYVKASDGSLVPAEHHVTDGLRIHLNLSGAHTKGIVGLRARRNPDAIDLRKKGTYKAEDYFEPLVGHGQLRIDRGEYYMIASKEVLRIPAHLNSELKRYSNLGIVGPLDFAGFIDNGFMGDLVFEIRSDEMASTQLEDGIPVSSLDFYHTEIPEELYGVDSHYQDQQGVTPAKYFMKFDFDFAARNYRKLDRKVLVQDADVLMAHRRKSTGFETMDDGEREALFADIRNGFFQYRYDCEDDKAVLQLLPYVVMFGPDRTVYSYVRASNIRDYGEAQLFGKHSIGLGGHVTQEDAPDYILSCLERETFGEEVDVEGGHSEPRFLGTVMQPDNPVDEVHFCLAFGVHAGGAVTKKESSITSGRMVSIDELMQDPERDSKYETWSRVLISHLPELYERSRS